MGEVVYLHNDFSEDVELEVRRYLNIYDKYGWVTACQWAVRNTPPNMLDLVLNIAEERIRDGVS